MNCRSFSKSLPGLDGALASGDADAVASLFVGCVEDLLQAANNNANRISSRHFIFMVHQVDRVRLPPAGASRPEYTLSCSQDPRKQYRTSHSPGPSRKSRHAR